MCGIAAIFSYRSTAAPVDESELLRIRERMVSRGPDGAGHWLSPDRRVGLAQRRLAIIDLSEGGAQPMSTPDGSVWITFNGEIYNYQDLRRDLEAAGYRFRSTSDTEVILNLYLEHGTGMFERLRGMYGFALWDSRKRALLLGRDPLGIKPLYYADDGSTLRVASQVKALIAGGQVDTSIEPAGHVGFFLWGSVPEPYTLHRGMRQLPGGSYMWAAEGSPAEIRSFASVAQTLTAARSGEPQPASSPDELREVLLDSVRRHLIADVPVGIFLSSGLDSATITALAAEARGSGIQTVTLAFDEYAGTDRDESPLAEEIARHCQTRHQTCRVSKTDFVEAVPRILDAMDQPTIDGVNTYFVSQVTAAHGIKVALSGVGGDELFGGYSTFSRVPSLVQRFGVGRYLPGVGRAVRIVSAPVVRHFTSPKYAGLLEYGDRFSGSYLLCRSLYMPWQLPQLLDGEVVRAGWQELQPLVRMEEVAARVGTPHATVAVLEMTRYLQNQLLRDTDWAAMAHSLEVRTPLVDLHVLRSLAPRILSPAPPTKEQMARTPQRSLPASILSRAKTGFSVPVHQWLMQSPDSASPQDLKGWAARVYHSFHFGREVCFRGPGSQQPVTSAA